MDFLRIPISPRDSDDVNADNPDQASAHISTPQTQDILVPQAVVHPEHSSDLRHVSVDAQSLQGHQKAEPEMEHLRAENARLMLENEKVTQELEELTQSLFEEANSLVSAEARARHAAELQLYRTQHELTATKMLLEQESQQLDELKRKMEFMQIRTSNPMPSSLSLFQGLPSLADDDEVKAPFLTIWNVLTPQELQNIAYPELSLSEHKKIFFKTESIHSFVTETAAGLHDTGLPSDDGRSIFSVDEVSAANCDTEASSSTQSTRFIRQTINEEGLYCHFDTLLFKSFLKSIGRSAPMPPKKLSSQSSIDSLSLTDEHDHSHLGDDKLSLSPRGYGRISSPLSRSSTPNPFGTSLRSYLNISSKPPQSQAVPFFRAFPAEFKKTGDPFLKIVYEEDIYPTLSFPLKSRAFMKQLLVVLAANKATFEKIPSPSLVGPSVFASSTIAPSSKPHSVSEKSSLDPKAVALHDTCCELCGRSILRFYPPMVMDVDHGDALDISEDQEDPSCSISRRPMAYKLVIEDQGMSGVLPKSQFLVDSQCRDRIVAVCDFFAFIRYFQAGFYGSIASEALFIKYLHLKRRMFYARTGSLPYFAVHDVTKLLHMIEEKLSHDQQGA